LAQSQTLMFKSILLNFPQNQIENEEKFHRFFLHVLYGALDVRFRYLAVKRSLTDCVHGDEEDRVWGEGVRRGVPVLGRGRDLVMNVWGAFYGEESGLWWGTPVEQREIQRHIMNLSISL